MVNAKNMMVGSVLTLSVAAIITWMNVNGLTTEDISLVDACYKSAQSKGINIETCDDLKDRQMEWDSVVPCEKGYKEDIYFWTPRMMFVYLAGGQSDIAALGRTSKGQQETGVVYDASMNLTFVQALEDRCNAMREETEYPFFVEGRRQFTRGVKIEDLDFSKFEDRNLYGWNQAWTWVLSSIGNCIASSIENDQGLADEVNYKACSVGLAFNALNAGGDYLTGPGGPQNEIYDHAECSGNNPIICKRYHHSGTDGWWNVHDRSGNNRLNNGCVNHDKCLNKCLKLGQDCDEDLHVAAKKGVNWSWPGISCSWRGCRTWWFAWCNSMSDARFWSGCVWLSMGGHPNEGFGSSGDPCDPGITGKCGGFCPPTNPPTNPPAPTMPPTNPPTGGGGGGGGWKEMQMNDYEVLSMGHGGGGNTAYNSQTSGFGAEHSVAMEDAPGGSMMQNIESGGGGDYEVLADQGDDRYAADNNAGEGEFDGEYNNPSFKGRRGPEITFLTQGGHATDLGERVAAETYTKAEAKLAYGSPQKAIGRRAPRGRSFLFA